MRIADKGVDHKSLWMDQRSQKHSLEGCQERGKLNKTPEQSEEGGARRGEAGRGGAGWGGVGES